MSNHPENELLTIPEAAGLLKLTVSTLRSWRLAKKFLVFLKVGGRVRIMRADLDRYLESTRSIPVVAQSVK